MATLQLTRPKQSQATGTWSSVFPAKQETEQQSAQFVKKLLAVAVSNLVYLRALFPEKAFGERSIDGLQLKVLRDDENCPGAWQITQWIKACFEAIDKKYLRQLTVLLYVDPTDPDTVIETYTFRFSYSQAGGVTMHHGEEVVERVAPSNNVTSEGTYKATVRMLRTIVVLTQTLRPLPEDVMISMKLLYYDDVTPDDYEPSGFRAALTHQVFFNTEPMNVRVGDVGTLHHTIKLRLKTDASQFEPPEEEPATELVKPEVGSAAPGPASRAVEPEPADACLTSKAGAGDGDGRRQRHPSAAAEPAAASQATSVGEGPAAADSVPGRSPALPASAEAAGGATPTSTDPRNAEASDDVHVRCSCGVHEDDGLMVLCEICQNWQHGICFLVLSEEEAPASHVCDACALETGRPCTDPRLPTLPKPTRMATCLYRRGLCACEEMVRLQPARLAQRLGVDVAVSMGLINRLDKDGLLKPTRGKGTTREVDKDRLFSHAFPRYLNRPAPDRPADTNQAETEAGRAELESAAPMMEQRSPMIRSKRSGAGDGLSPSPPPRRTGRKRTATPKCRPERPFELADSEDFAPESTALAGSESKRFKVSRTDGIVP